MPSEIEELRNRLKREAAEYDGQIRQFVREYLTEDELRRRWTRLSAAVDKGNETRVSWVDALRERAASFFDENLFPKVAGFATAAAVIVIALVIILPGGPQQLSLTAVPDSERATAVRLPKNLQLNLQKRSLEFWEGGDRLSGSLSPSAQEGGISIFSVTLRGKDSTGNDGRFTGTMWLTNAAGVIAIKKPRDVAGALVRGSLEVLGQNTNKVDQSFLP